MTIKKISFYSADRKEDGAMCSCCGKWIKNVCVIDTVEEGRVTLGTTCYEKQIKDRLNSMQKKKFNALVKSVKALQDRVDEWENMTEESYKETHAKKTEYNYKNGEYVTVEMWEWEVYNETFETFKSDIIDNFKTRLNESIKQLAKYKVQG